MNENKTINITTIDELKNYIGKYIVCYYYKDYIEEFRDHYLQRPNLSEDNIQYMWMFKLTELGNDGKDNTVRGRSLYGRDTVVLRDSICPTMKPHYIGIGNMAYSTKGEVSSAQSYVRTPTKEEMKTYMNIFRHKRIFGT